MYSFQYSTSVEFGAILASCRIFELLPGKQEKNPIDKQRLNERLRMKVKTGGFPNDIRPVNIKLKRVAANINSNRVSVNMKLKRVAENINSNRVSKNIKLKRVSENMRIIR